MILATQSLIFTGTQINYYFVCKKKLWLFSKNISMEHNSDAVLIGKLLHEKSYERKSKEIEIGPIKIDFIERMCEVHEIKKSKKIKNSHIYQVLYYLYYLKSFGIEAKGVIDYPLLRRRENVVLTKEKINEIKNILSHIQQILSRNYPPDVNKKPYCKKCSYYELCWC